MSTLDKRKKKKIVTKELGWVKWFGIALAILTAAAFIAMIWQMINIAA